jgi:hypothetical protein
MATLAPSIDVDFAEKVFAETPKPVNGSSWKGTLEIRQFLVEFREAGVLPVGSRFASAQLAEYLWDNPIRPQIWPKVLRHGFARTLGDVLGKHGLKLRKTMAAGDGNRWYYEMPVELPVIEGGKIIVPAVYLAEEAVIS